MEWKILDEETDFNFSSDTEEKERWARAQEARDEWQQAQGLCLPLIQTVRAPTELGREGEGLRDLKMVENV